MSAPVPHDMPCLACHHGGHHFFPCECGCVNPPTPGIYQESP